LNRAGFSRLEGGIFLARAYATTNKTYLPGLLLGLLTPAWLWAIDEPKQITQYVETSLTVKNGLPQNSVGAVTQTSDGYIWFGTEEGVGRYDGLRITTFDTAHHRTLKDNFIKSLAPGREGSLWVGTRSSLTQLKDGEFHPYFTAESPINSILEAQDGTVWVGSQNGLYSLRGGRVRRFTSADGLPSNTITKVLEAADGTLWLGTRQGLASWSNGRFRSYGASDGVPVEPISSLAPSRDGALWIATAGQVIRWKDRLLETAPIKLLPVHDQITSLLEDRTGALWVGFDHNGIALLHDGEFSRYTARQGLPSEDVATLFEDREGDVWAGLSEGGVVELRDGIFSNFGVQEGLSDDMIWSVLEARDESVWVGTNSKGLDHIARDGTVRVYTEKDGLPGGSVYALREGPDGSIWIGAEHGALCQLKNGKIRVFSDPLNKGQRIVSILPASLGLPDTSGDLWLAFHETEGLVRFHLDRGHGDGVRGGSFEHFDVPGLPNTASFGPDGSIWIGSDHAGVSQFRNNRTVARYTTENGLLANFAQAIYVDREGVVWAGTSPGGLNRIKNGRVTTYSIDQGLFDLTVGAIVEDKEGYLWMTCNKGIYKVSKKELNDYAEGRAKAIHSLVYGTADGLRSSECNFAADPAAWRGKGGRLWFPTTAGIASVDPKHSQTINAEPSPLIESVEFNQHAKPFYNGVKAGPGGGDLEVQFTAPDFVAPERIRFRYRLNGSDSDWVAAGNRRMAMYTKLAPGNYRFEVQAADATHGWSTNAAGLRIELKPLFWQTTWFKVLGAVILLCAAAALYWLRIHFLLVQNKLLEERVQSRTTELQRALQAAEDAGRALHEQATKDGLTGLWNRRSIFELLGKELPRTHRAQLPISVLMADLDHFKSINDTYGHQVGDRVLQVVAERIMGLTRPYDFVGRYGGEEFVIVLPGCSLEDGLHRAEEFRRAIADTTVISSAGPIQVTCSFGVAENVSRDSAEELINSADEALYCAKKAGRNCVRSRVPRSGARDTGEGVGLA
jgi:diguanylate cyclase (GGDEF)-like protein